MFLDVSDPFDKYFEAFSSTDNAETEQRLRIRDVMIPVLSSEMGQCTDSKRKEECEMDLFFQRLMRIYWLGRLHGEGVRQVRLQVISGNAHKLGPRP